MIIVNLKQKRKSKGMKIAYVTESIKKKKLKEAMPSHMTSSVIWK